MLLDDQIKKAVTYPSLGSTIYQARSLIQELELINDKEYPRQACQIRDVFLSIIKHIEEQLEELCSSKDLLRIEKEEVFFHVRSLREILHEIYSYIRYLRASSPHQSPPAIQVALTQLTDLYFPKENGAPVCLVRPQWKYNLAYVPITWSLKKILSLSTLDPEGKFGVSSSDELILTLWKKRRASLPKEERKQTAKNPPSQLAILSFAGLDTHNTFLFPLLGHELGHFIDYSFNPPLHLQDSLRKNLDVNIKKILGIDIDRLLELKEDFIEQIFTCLRELLADLIAVRMLGFSFFVAQAEFLKSLDIWPGQIVEPSGYPGIKFRLSVVFNHLVSDVYSNNILQFLEKHIDTEESEKANRIILFIGEWKKYLNEVTDKVPNEDNGTQSTEQTLEEAVAKIIQLAISDLYDLAQRVIPDERCAYLTPSFFERIARLHQELPPSCQNDNPKCFSEILSAAWAYQILYGEQREVTKQDVDEKLTEYRQTCRLVLKAIELIPAYQAKRSKEKRTRKPQGRSEVNKDRRGVLSATYIRGRINLPICDPSHLAVIPFYPNMVGECSLDVHLGNWFVVARRTRLRSVRLDRLSEERMLMTLGREEVFVHTDSSFLIHPGDFVLGCTLEFIALPGDLMAFVEGRSGLGRMGLIVATATPVAPGFHGVVVLELANTGTVPLEVVPGMSVAQLVFQVMTEHLPKGYHGKYQCQIKP